MTEEELKADIARLEDYLYDALRWTEPLPLRDWVDISGRIDRRRAELEEALKAPRYAIDPSTAGHATLIVKDGEVQ